MDKTQPENKKAKILPFRQDVDFFLKRGAKERDRNDLLAAVQRYRQAYHSDPADLDSCLALSEVLSQMQRYEESNRLLLVDMSMNDPDPESYFGLACNYYGMHEYAYAKESLETYLELDPEGFYAYDAMDFLDLLEDPNELMETVGVAQDESLETLTVCQRARHATERGDLAQAAALLEAHLARVPTALRAKNQLAVVCYCMGDKARALALSGEVLSADPNDIQARCNQTLFLCMGEDAQSTQVQEALDALQLLRPEEPDELASISLLQLEFGRYAAAQETLQRLWQYMPYDENVIHRMGYCRYLQGDVEGAQSCYRRLLRIDPDDTVARYYLNACRKYDAKAHARHWQLPYRVPLGETFRRFQQINTLLDEPQAEIVRRWREDRATRNLLLWALTMQDQRSKSAILHLVAGMQDAEAERALRDFLLRTDQPDGAKREALALLTRMQAREPFMAYLDGQWVQGRVSALELPKKLPAAYEGVLQLLAAHLLPDCTEEVLLATAGIIRRYLAAVDGHYPRISANQQHSFAAALELLGRQQAGEQPDEEAIARKYRVSLLRLHNAVQKFAPYREEP